MHRHVFHPREPTENLTSVWKGGGGGPFSARLFLLWPVEVAARQPLCGPGKRMDVNPSVPHMTKLQCVWKPGTEHGRFVVFNFFSHWRTNRRQDQFCSLNPAARLAGRQLQRPFDLFYFFLFLLWDGQPLSLCSALPSSLQVNFIGMLYQSIQTARK